MRKLYIVDWYNDYFEPCYGYTIASSESEAKEKVLSGCGFTLSTVHDCTAYALEELDGYKITVS